MKNVYFRKKHVTVVLLLALFTGISGCNSGTSNNPANTPSNTPAHTATHSPGLSVSTEPSAVTGNGQASGGLAAGAGGVKFKYLYRGFTAVGLEDTETLAAFDEVSGDRVILTEAAWQDYMEKYCPGIHYYEDVDFKSECLIVGMSMGSKSTFATGLEVRAVTVGTDTMPIRYNDDPSTFVYALNTADVAHFYVCVLVISRGDLPEGEADGWVYA